MTDPARGWREGLKAEPPGLPGARLTWTARAEMRGGGGGPGLGRLALRRLGALDALLGRDGPAVSLLRLDSPSGRSRLAGSPGRRWLPNLLPGRPYPALPPVFRCRCAGPRARGERSSGGVCADTGQARICRRGFAWVAACVSACWGAHCAPAPPGRAWGHPEAGGVGCGSGPKARSVEGPRHWSSGRGR